MLLLVINDSRGQIQLMREEVHLFSKYDIHSICQSQKLLLRDSISKASEQELFTQSEQDTIEVFARKWDLSVPRILHDRIESSQESAQVDVSHDHRRHFLDRSRPFYLPGTIYTIHVPFEGEPILFDVRPSSYTLSPPRGRVHGQELQFLYEVVPDTPFDIKGDYGRRLAEVGTHLESLRSSAEMLDQELLQIATANIQSRRAQFQAARNAVQNLGLPVRQSPISPASNESPNTASQKRASRGPKVWDVFISHASEDKVAIAAPLAHALESRGLRVWYDQSILRVGDSLRASIDHGLAKSRFGVVILSEHFFSKHWPVKELNGLASREVNGAKVILPVWHNIDHDRIAEFSPMLADRMGTLSSDGLDKVVSDLLLAVG